MLLVLVFLANFFLYSPPTYKDDQDLLLPGDASNEYALSAIGPQISSSSEGDFEKLLVISKLIVDGRVGVGSEATEVNRIFIHYFLEKARLGYIYRMFLPTREAELLKRWYWKYVREDIPGVFFAPSGEEIVLTKAAFGCSHYSRAFLSIANAIGIPKDPERLRYAICCTAEDYNRALDAKDKSMTINGHQFAIYRNADERWIAINTSKAEYVELPHGFTPDAVRPPHNISIEFPSYPGVTFLFREISADSKSACNDDSLRKLMNIYRSGDSENSAFQWNRFE